MKLEVLKASLKKTGNNKFAGYKYYELSDFMPTVIELCNKYKVFTKTTFYDNEAILVAINIENPEEKETYTSPMRDLELKGCNAIQALGGVETYQRRYLYMSMLDLTENDMFDGQKDGGVGDKTQLDTKKKELIDYVSNLIKNGADKEAMYDIVSSKNNGNKNPNTIKSVKVCNEILKEIKNKFEEK